jgi:hypothetical protein
MMLAADRIAANVLTATPELCNALYRKYLEVFRKSGSGHIRLPTGEARRRSSGW